MINFASDEDINFVGLYELLKGCDEITPTGLSGSIGEHTFYEISYYKKGREVRGWYRQGETSDRWVPATMLESRTLSNGAAF